MAITPDDIEFLTLRIYGVLKIPAGTALGAERLQAEWRKTRLRRGDLQQGLQLLLVRGALHKTAEGYQLTQIGFTLAYAIRRRNIRSMLTRMRIMTKLSLLRSGAPGVRRERAAGDADQRI